MIILTGGTIALSGIFASSYMKSLNSFIVLYGGLSGIGCGMMYFVPLVCGWEWFPKRRGLVTGIIVGSYGLGSFIFTQIATQMVNPDDAKAEIYINNDLSYFEPEIADRVPGMFRMLVLIWSCQIITAVVLVSRPDKADNNEPRLVPTTERENIVEDHLQSQASGSTTNTGENVFYA